MELTNVKRHDARGETVDGRQTQGREDDCLDRIDRRWYPHRKGQTCPTHRAVLVPSQLIPATINFLRTGCTTLSSLRNCPKKDLPKKWCSRWESNPHALAGTSTSSWRVCHSTTRAGRLNIECAPICNLCSIDKFFPARIEKVGFLFRH